MSVPIAILALVLLALVVQVVSEPLRAAGRERPGETDPGRVSESKAAALSCDLYELRAERDAKYREIRDAELDFRTGKLSAEDYSTIDSQLRAEALAILNRLEAEDSEG